MDEQKRYVLFTAYMFKLDCVHTFVDTHICVHISSW